jgi:hypothetical protein
MSCDICRIEALANGFEVSLRDPAKAKKNDSSKNSVWVDPMVSYAFSDMDKMIEFLRTNLPKAAADDDEYSSTFESAAKEK